MCQALETIKFCSCADNFKASRNKKEAYYIWILDRVEALNNSGLMGLTMLPKSELGELKPEFIVLELNAKNLFDFDYQPEDNDSLRIEHVMRKKSGKREGLFGEYLNFYFYDGQWHIGQVDPFSYDMKQLEKGKVEIEKVDNG